MHNTKVRSRTRKEKATPAAKALPFTGARTFGPAAQLGEPNPPIDDLGFGAESTAAYRDYLVTSHIGLVHHVARQIMRSGVGGVTIDELVSAGMFGLLRAATAFDPSQGTMFSTYAIPCIRGAVLDELRKLDHMPRALRHKVRRMAGAEDRLTQTLGRSPTQGEVADHLEVDHSTMWQWRAEVARTRPVSLDEPQDEEASIGLADLIAEDREGEYSPESGIQKEQTTALLQNALLGLRTQERTVLSLMYYEGLTLAQVGVVLNVSESRVSQVRTKALASLRRSLAPMREALI